MIHHECNLFYKIYCLCLLPIVYSKTEASYLHNTDLCVQILHMYVIFNCTSIDNDTVDCSKTATVSVQYHISCQFHYWIVLLEVVYMYSIHSYEWIPQRMGIAFLKCLYNSNYRHFIPSVKRIFDNFETILARANQ